MQLSDVPPYLKLKKIMLNSFKAYSYHSNVYLQFDNGDDGDLIDRRHSGYCLQHLKYLHHQLERAFSAYYCANANAQVQIEKFFSLKVAKYFNLIL